MIVDFKSAEKRSVACYPFTKLREPRDEGEKNNRLFRNYYTLYTSFEEGWRSAERALKRGFQKEAADLQLRNFIEDEFFFADFQPW